VTDLPSRARVVVIGGGVIGTSVAYHLAHLGWTDVVLLEQGTLSCGTTWHAAGLVGQLRATEASTRLVQYSTDLYSRLEAETGLATGYRVCGGLTLARTPERMVQLRRTWANAAAYDLECELLTVEQAKQRYPLIRDDDLVGAIWLPGDGVANPTDLTQALAKGARMRGVRVFERVRVTGVDVTDGRATGVRTDHGDVEAEVVVNCAGQWAKAVAAFAGATVPLHSAEHFYVVTDQIEGVHRGLPVLRDPDGYTYVKEEVGGLLVGGFEPEAKPWVAPEAIPYPFEFQLLDEDWEHFAVLMDSAIHRIPVLAETGIRKFYNGPESFTPDNQFVIGEAPEVAGFFVAAGFNSVGIASAGGAGRALAEWIVEGEPTMDLVSADIRRFAPFQGETPWLRSRVSEVLGLHYAVPWPTRELQSGRPQLRSPLHDRYAAAGAWFGSKMGWERANYVAGPGVSDPSVPYGWERPGWQDWVDAEQQATRSAVALFDQTSFAKVAVSGPDALALLQHVCTADVSGPVGTATYTGMLNSRGGYEADVTVTRTGQADFLVVTGSASRTRDADWLRRHVAPGGAVVVEDVTTEYAVLGLMGPRSREVLEAVSAARFDNAAFPFATSRLVDLAGVEVRATRITYVGELGWELYVPMADAERVFDALTAAGAPLGLRLAGYYAIEALRLEKGYRAFGRELTPEIGPVEAGLTFACKLGTDLDFVGRAALEERRASGPARRVVSVTVEDPAAYAWGGELVLRDGEPVGQVTSVAWGATAGRLVGLALVGDRSAGTATRDWLRSGRWELDLLGRAVPLTVGLRAPVDPEGARLDRG